ncbi:MAG: pantetheine-phosphate adenylyltransferase [Paenibacillaceae bacterium]|nr:pantetheine-phosphate adenylyltransferase [Paenibacillaceae bacterium]
MQEGLGGVCVRSRIAVYPGSFDPVTLGHMDIIERAAKQFDRLIVAVLHAPSKVPLFAIDERKRMLRAVTEHMPNVEVDGFGDLLVRYMRDRAANVIVRGLRAVSDFEYELQMASTNHKLHPQVETLFMMTSPEYSYLSSSIVKEIAKFHGPIDDLVPPLVADALRDKYRA